MAFAAVLLAQPQSSGLQLLAQQRWQLVTQLLYLLQQALLPHWQVCSFVPSGNALAASDL